MANPIQMVKSFSVTTIAIDIHVFVAKELTLRYIHLCKSWLEAYIHSVANSIEMVKSFPCDYTVDIHVFLAKQLTA